MTSAELNLHLAGGAVDAPDLLLIHGFGADRYGWALNTATLSEALRVWLVELPGHGSSAAHPAALPTEMADAVLQSVGGKLGSSFAVAGHSLGGAVALEIARQAPDKVSRMALIAPLGLGAGINETFLKRFPELDSPTETESILRLLVERPRLISPQMVAHVLEFLKTDANREGLRRIATEVLALGRIQLPEGSNPTVIWGENDQVNSPDLAWLKELGATVHVLPKTGHLPQIESVMRTNRILLEALAG